MIAQQWKRTKVPQFWTSATVSFLMTLSATALLTAKFWRLPGTHPWGVFFVAAIIAGGFVQLWRIHRAYDASYQKAVDGDEPTQKLLSEIMRTYRWSHITFFVLAITVVLVYMSR
jgi:hypothetical protein